MFLLAAVFSCKAASSLDEGALGLFIGRARHCEGKESKIMTFFFSRIQHQTQLLQAYNFTLALSSSGPREKRLCKCVEMAALRQSFTIHGCADNLKTNIHFS